ncbi:MAG TPA: ATP-binding cassette domain-containing protein [Kofleriaceae bacterium]|jgi:ABC-type nitrate/sulfonate/bicarbonate transport system ATPase subunit|nr:ATP-binding cassette domain-containing protein [Kofleriaceae bacterium]
MTAVITLDAVGFGYGAVTVLDRLDLEVRRGELLVCVGPSGCGKSTLLALLGGHLAPSRGRIERRGASRTIYQDGGLFPWLTVAQNVALGVPRGASPAERTRKVDDWLGTAGLAEFRDHYPHQLSGGMRQRVELGRALVAETDLLLLDEPFSALDYQSRVRMRRELAATLQARPRTVVLVTHDIEEAVQLGDRIVVLGARPSSVRRTLELPAGRRPRLPADPGVAEAEQIILDELGLS